MRDPHHNKGMAFTEKERESHYLTGLLPPTVFSQELQVIDMTDLVITISFLLHHTFLPVTIPNLGHQDKRFMNTLREYKVPLQRYIAMMDLQVGNTHFNECIYSVQV